MANFSPLAAEIVSLVWGTPANFNGFRFLAAFTALPNFAGLNRGRHLYSAGRPSSWALATFLIWLCIKHLIWNEIKTLLFTINSRILYRQHCSVNCRIVQCFLWPPNRAGHYILQLWFLLSFFLAYSQRLETGCLPYFLTWRGLSANLKGLKCCTRLAGNTGRKNSPSAHHRTTAQSVSWSLWLLFGRSLFPFSS